MPPQRRPPAGRGRSHGRGRRGTSGPVPLLLLAAAITAIVVAIFSGRIFDSSSPSADLTHDSRTIATDTTPAVTTGPGTPAASTRTGTTTGPPAATTSPAGRTVRVYLVEKGLLAAEPRTVPAGTGVGTAALQALLDGRDFHLAIAGGTATVTGAGSLDHAAQAEVVATLTQFPTVQRVVIDGSTPLTRLDIEDVTPPILVETPLPGDRVASPLRVTGTANVFEATFMVEVLDKDGNRLSQKVVTATSGTGTRGTFDAQIGFDTAGEQAGTLYAYEPSAQDGQPIHEVRVPLTLLP